MWTMLLVTGQAPELQPVLAMPRGQRAEPWRIAMHLAAGFATAILLVGSGIGPQGGKRWGTTGMLFALWMLVYAVIQSSGYYLPLGSPAFVAMFAVPGVLAVSFALRLATEG